MKTKRILLEAVGMILAVIGAFFLVLSLMPLINPGFVKVSLKQNPSVSSSNIFLLIVSLGILCGGIFCSRKATKLGKAEASLGKKDSGDAGTKN